MKLSYLLLSSISRRDVAKGIFTKDEGKVHLGLCKYPVLSQTDILDPSRASLI